MEMILIKKVQVPILKTGVVSERFNSKSVLEQPTIKWHICDEFDQLRGEGRAKHKVRIGPTVNRAKCDREERRKHSIGFSLEDANGDLEKPATERVQTHLVKNV